MVLLAFSPMGSIYAQETSTTIPRVSAGQRVPEEFWTKEFQFYDHEKIYTQTLEQYRGKPIILAFWSISCGTCISSFPLLNEALDKYGDKVVILPVNSYDKNLSRVDGVMQRFDDTYYLTGIVFDDYLKHVFSHTVVPHYIWVRPNGTVGAITVKSFLTMDNISKFVE